MGGNTTFLIGEENRSNKQRKKCSNFPKKKSQFLSNKFRNPLCTYFASATVNKYEGTVKDYFKSKTLTQIILKGGGAIYVSLKAQLLEKS